MKPPAKGVQPGLGPSKSDADKEAIADALEVATGTRPSPEAVDAFCMAVVLATQTHEEGGY